MSNKEISKFIEKVATKDFNIFNAVFENPFTEKEEQVFEHVSSEDNNANVTIIFGDNASGKSLFVRILEAGLRKRKIAVRTSSIANRTAGGMEAAMIFGDQREESTGKVSVEAIVKGINSMKKADKDKESVFIADEPEIGLSNSYSKALGKYFVQEANAIDKEKQSIVIVTHNPSLVESILEENIPVNFIGVNTELTLKEWIVKKEDKTIEELLKLGKLGFKKWRGIQDTLSNK